MIRNYWKVALRYLAKHRGYSFINILGLAVGIASCILIMLFVKSEWSFDRFHQKSDRIYRAWLEEHYEGQVFTNTVTPVPLAPVLQAGIPELESTCRVFAFNTQVKSGNQSFNDPVNMVDSSFFRLFDFPPGRRKSERSVSKQQICDPYRRSSQKIFWKRTIPR